MQNKIILIIFLFEQILQISLHQSQEKQNLAVFNSLLQKAPLFKNLTQNEQEYRMLLFNKSLQKINESNSINDGRTKLEVNFFSIMNDQEKKQFLGFNPKIKKQPQDITLSQFEPNQDLRARQLIKSIDISSLQQNGALQYLKVQYNELNDKEKKWVDYWQAQISKVDNIFKNWFEGIKKDCQQYISIYGAINKVKLFCQDYYNNSILARHKQNIQEQMQFMDQDYQYVTQRWNKTFAKLLNYYQQFRTELQSAEQQYQDSILNQFNEFMKIFDNQNSNDSQNTDNNTPVGEPQTIRDAVNQGIIPQQVDWVQASKISPVKNQGGCGSCWSFSTAGMLESMHLMQKNEVIDLSEQYLINCSLQNFGCDGGLMSIALDYIKDNQITYESVLPYAGKKTSCPTSATHYGIQSWDHLKTGENILEFLKVLKQRPVTIAYHVSDPFYSYKAGEIVKYNDLIICPTNGTPNHGVMAVGYYVDPSDDNNIWVNFKNSWGTSWGNSGYFKMGLNNRLDSYGWGTCQMLRYYDEVTWAVVTQFNSQYNFYFIYYYQI